MSTATLTSKGQITLPQAVRQALGVEAGDKIDFVAEADGGFRVQAMADAVQTEAAARRALAPRKTRRS
jgi:antitoxin PrlF